MNNSGYNDYGSLGGAAVAVSGAAAIAAAMGDSKEAHKESLSELGKSLNLETALKVIAQRLRSS